MVFEEAAGLVRITFDWSGAAPLARLDAPQPLSLGETIPAAIIAECAGVGESDVLTSMHQPVVAGVGTPFVIAESTGRPGPGCPAMPLRCGQQRRGFQSRRSAFRCTSMRCPAPGRRTRMSRLFQAFPRTRRLAARNVALAALLLSRSGDDALSITIEQGVEMGRPSLLFATAHRAADGIRASIGGSAVAVSRGTITV